MRSGIIAPSIMQDMLAIIRRYYRHHWFLKGGGGEEEEGQCYEKSSSRSLIIYFNLYSLHRIKTINGPMWHISKFFQALRKKMK